MKIATWAAAIVAVAALLFLMFDGGTEPASSLSATSERVEQRTGLDVPLSLIEVDRATPTAESDIAPEPTAAEVPVQPLAEEPKLATMKGRFLLPDGNPAVGVNVKLLAYQANRDLLPSYGLPADWKNQECQTDAEGRFEFRFDPPAACQVLVGARLAGYKEASWRWASMPPGKVTELGTLRFVAAERLERNLMDEERRRLEARGRTMDLLMNR